jgi:hypothetical protein
MASKKPNRKPQSYSRGSSKLIVVTMKVLDPPEPIKKYPKAKYPKDRRRPGNKR